MEKGIYVFHSAHAQFCSAVFSSKETAEVWISENCLTGMLTAYPLDQSAYSWAVGNGYFKPKKEHHFEPGFIGSFTSAHQEHYHYENGKRPS